MQYVNKHIYLIESRDLNEHFMDFVLNLPKNWKLKVNLSVLDLHVASKTVSVY